jgi:TATA-box binding protein (TBP) (component of TFIID and TFIIIB)
MKGLKLYQPDESVNEALRAIGARNRMASRRNKRNRNRNRPKVPLVPTSSIYNDGNRSLSIIPPQQFAEYCRAMKKSVELRRSRGKQAEQLLRRLCPQYLQLGQIMPSSANLEKLQATMMQSQVGEENNSSGSKSKKDAPVHTSKNQRDAMMAALVSEDPLKYGNVLFYEESDFTPQFHLSGAPRPRSPPWLVNFAIVFTLGVTNINLEGVRAIPELVCLFSNCGFPALTVRFRLESGVVGQCVTMRIHRSGRVVLTGARTECQALIGSHNLVHLLLKNGFPVAMCNFAIQNLVLTMDAGWRIDLDRLNKEQSLSVTYIKDNFPLAEYKLGSDPRYPGEKRAAHVALISRTGKMVVAGTKSREEAKQRCMQAYLLAWTYREEASVRAPDPSTSNSIVGFICEHDFHEVLNVLGAGYAALAEAETNRDVQQCNTLEWLDRNSDARVNGRRDGTYGVSHGTGGSNNRRIGASNTSEFERLAELLYLNDDEDTDDRSGPDDMTARPLGLPPTDSSETEHYSTGSTTNRVEITEVDSE